MNSTVAHLIRGDVPIGDHYRLAADKWSQILTWWDGKNIEALASKLELEQSWFEHNCGGKLLGQEVMATVGIAQFYDDRKGFGEDFEKAKRVYKAFQTSLCSIEVKGQARSVARSYGLLN